MHWTDHNRMNARRQQKIEELRQAYWSMYARRGFGTTRDRRRRRDLADRAQRSLLVLGVQLPPVSHWR